MTTATSIFGDAIYSYTRKQAIDDGVLIDASSGDFAEVSRQHYRYPVAMTAAVFGLIERAVSNRKYCNDFLGIWHDILWMSKCGKVRQWQTGCEFRVIVTGVGRKRYHNLKIECGPGDDGEPVLTVMLADED